MNETRVKVMPVTDLLEYKIRFRARYRMKADTRSLASRLKNPDLVDAIMNILDLDLSEADTIAKVERLV